ncbi:MAG: hypothetical protein ABF575_09295 [Liquorilactobacillus hordei]|uniref:hypothetical protein n=1 Tax=Liquorilactobacillus hordei TaxID=468911 RepID=UPI0039EC48B3
MKKKGGVLILAILGITLILTACGQGKTTADYKEMVSQVLALDKANMNEAMSGLSYGHPKATVYHDEDSQDTYYVQVTDSDSAASFYKKVGKGKWKQLTSDDEAAKVLQMKKVYVHKGTS